MREEDFRLPDKLAYQNIEAEQCCLGAALQDQKSVERLKTMSVDDFTLPEHRVIYGAIIENAAKGNPIDLVNIHSVLTAENKIELIGGDNVLLNMIMLTPTTANMKSYIKIVQECTARRKLKEIGEYLVTQSGHTENEIEGIREKAALSVREVRGTDNVLIINQQDAIAMTYEQMEKAQKRDGKVNDRIMTGIKQLDKMTGGLKGSKLMIIGARPSVGKSIFAMTICMNAAAHGKRVLYVSLEMEAEELMEREFAAESLVPLTEITSDEIEDESWMKIADSLISLSEKKIFYCTDIHFVEEVRKAAFSLYENGGLDLICVDYIQLLKTTQKRNSRQEEVADISRSLKWLAQELKIPVIALSQLNRSSAKEKRPPTMAEARESGAIEQDANIFLLLHDPDIDELKNDDLRRLNKNLNDHGMKLIYVNVDKNRQGKKGVFYIAFDGDHMRFLPLSKESPP